MAKLVVLDASSGSVISFIVNHLAQGRLEEIYDNDVEAWFSGDGYEDRFNINLSCCNYLWVEDESLIEEHEI